MNWLIIVLIATLIYNEAIGEAEMNCEQLDISDSNEDDVFSKVLDTLTDIWESNQS